MIFQKKKKFIYYYSFKKTHNVHTNLARGDVFSAEEDNVKVITKEGNIKY